MNETLAPLKALADGNRLRVVAALLEHEELCVCQITTLLGIATPTVSRHMSILLTARLVESRKEGRWVYYRLHGMFPEQLQTWLRSTLATSATVKEDHSNLAKILSCSPLDLCKQQRTQGRSQNKNEKVPTHESR